MNPHPRHGYYEVAGKIYTNKLEAFNAAIPNNYFPHWNYRDEEFGRVDWGTEPTETLEQLYFERALSIRLKYDYLLLSYSGGEDSHTAAESFIKNGLEIDQLMNRSAKESYLGEDVKDGRNMGQEAVFAAKPQVEKLRQYQPNINITHLTWGEELVDLWNNTIVKVNDLNSYTASSLGKKFLYRYFPKSLQFKRAGLIYAIDKPFLYLVDGKYYIAFIDERMNPHIMNETEADPESPFECISFFWDPAAEKILRKQAHILIRWFEANPQYKNLLEFPHRSDAWGSGAYDEIVKTLLYPSHDKSLWQVKKTKFFFWYEEEHWWQNHKDSPAVQKWRRLVDEYSTIVFEMFSRAGKINYIKKDGPNWQLPACFSKLHLIK
jgi:hypothetical protein